MPQQYGIAAHRYLKAMRVIRKKESGVLAIENITIVGPNRALN